MNNRETFNPPPQAGETRNPDKPVCLICQDGHPIIIMAGGKGYHEAYGIMWTCKKYL